jgi:hypothetical protein
MITAVTSLALIIGFGVLAGVAVLGLIICTDILWPRVKAWWLADEDGDDEWSPLE